MPTLTAIDQIKQKKTDAKPRRVSKARFLREYADREDGYKYEWNNGVIEKTESINQQQAFIQAIIMRYFTKTQIFVDGGLELKKDCVS